MLITSDDLTLDDLLARLEQIPEAATITLCGSSRFGWAFNAASRFFTLPPYLYKVLSIGEVKSSDADLKRHCMLTEEDQVLLPVSSISSSTLAFQRGESTPLPNA